jgi:hypothetical protein
MWVSHFSACIFQTQQMYGIALLVIKSGSLRVHQGQRNNKCGDWWVVTPTTKEIASCNGNQFFPWPKNTGTERSNGRLRVPGTTHHPTRRQRSATDGRYHPESESNGHRCFGPATGARAGCHGAGPAFPKHFRSDLSNRGNASSTEARARRVGQGHVRQRDPVRRGWWRGPPRRRPHGHVHACVCAALHFMAGIEYATTPRRTGAAVTSSSSSRH